ncbi:hypothetical protein FRC08_000220 [Ceratobasidium sp. 394]|nr:hypothetical protein FRC08_000220 [Ceratobasidium sp. 394]
MIVQCEYNENCVKLVLQPFEVTPDFSCAGNGLIYCDCSRVSLEAIATCLSEEQKDNTRKKRNRITKDWLRAQCKFLGLPAGSNQTEGALRKRLLERIATNQGISPELEILENEANEQFRAAIEDLRLLAGDMAFKPTERDAKRRRVQERTIDSSTKKKKCKRSHSNNSKAKSNQPPTEFNNTEEQEEYICESEDEMQIDDHEMQAAAPAPRIHPRGGDSAIPDTSRLRAKAPQAVAESFLNQMVMSTSQEEQARELTRAFSTQALAPPSHEEIAPNEGLDGQCWQKISKCLQASAQSDLSGLSSMFAQVELAMVSSRRAGDFSNKEAYELLGDTDVREDQFKHWLRNGHVLLRLIYASSIHVMSIIAVSSMRTWTCRLLPDDRYQVENALRDPAKCDDIKESLVNLIHDDIIGFHRRMCIEFPKGITVGGHTFGDLSLDDEFLGGVYRPSHGGKPHDIGVIARGEIWFAAPTPALSLLAPPGSLFVISTNFQPERSENKAMPTELEDPHNGSAIYRWTSAQRQLAQKALCPESLEDLSDKMKKQLEAGVKPEGSYIKIPSNLTQTSDVLIHGVGGQEEDLICLILSADTVSLAMQSKIWKIATQVVAFDHKAVDTAALGEAFVWKACHCGWWNRYALAGQNAPKDVHPRLHMGSACQTVPYLDRASRALADPFDPNHFGYCPHEQLNNMIADLLRPALVKLHQYIPNLMAIHQSFSNSLGPTYTLGSSPFCMTVLNIQAASRGHRDKSDQYDTVCLVYSLGVFTGGDLCVYEPGAVIPLLPGTFAAIRSKRNVHFNLDYVGNRFSFVFTSDGALERWDQHRNGWVSLQPFEFVPRS